MTTKELDTLVMKLKSYDNEAGYQLEHEELETLMKGTVMALVDMGEGALDRLYGLLLDEETWSCYYSLKIIRGIKSQSSIPFLMDYLIVNDGSEYYENCEEAMYALSEMGAPAVEPLLAAVRTAFGQDVYPLYLMGALTPIVDERVYVFIKSTLEDYLANPEKYLEWFDIVPFMFDLDKHGRKETTVPLLKAILDMGHLNKFEKTEIRDTIFILEDPEGWEESLKKNSERLKAILEEPGETEEPGKAGRNQPCPCGSGNKYKYCCLKKNEAKRKGNKKQAKRRA